MGLQVRRTKRFQCSTLGVHNVPRPTHNISGVSFLVAGPSRPARTLAVTMRHIGIVSSFNNLKGIGFLTCPGRADVLCRYTAIRRPEYPTLMRGEAVEYDIVQGGRGEEADNVIVVPDIYSESGERHAPNFTRPAL